MNVDKDKLRGALNALDDRGLPTRTLRASYRKARKFIQVINRQLFLDLNADYRNAIFLAGTGRSGTTWVSNIINLRGDYRYIFEPFNRYRVRISQAFEPNLYLRPSDQGTVYRNPARAILSGRVRSHWTDRHNQNRIFNKRLVKDIRANLFLKWLKVNFPEVPVVLLLRHPCAVAHSRLRKGFPSDLDGYLRQEKLRSDFLSSLMAEVESAETEFERHIFRWCIENSVPLRQFGSDEIHLAFYENFCVDPEGETRRLFRFLDMSWDESVHYALRSPSPEVRKGSAILTGEDLITGWVKYISPSQVRQAREILSLFGLEGIYTEDPLPDSAQVYAILAT